MKKQYVKMFESFIGINESLNVYNPPQVRLNFLTALKDHMWQYSIELFYGSGYTGNPENDRRLVPGTRNEILMGDLFKDCWVETDDFCQSFSRDAEGRSDIAVLVYPKGGYGVSKQLSALNTAGLISMNPGEILKDGSIEIRMDDKGNITSNIQGDNLKSGFTAEQKTMIKMTQLMFQKAMNFLTPETILQLPDGTQFRPKDGLMNAVKILGTDYTKINPRTGRFNDMTMRDTFIDRNSWDYEDDDWGMEDEYYSAVPQMPGWGKVHKVDINRLGGTIANKIAFTGLDLLRLIAAESIMKLLADNMDANRSKTIKLSKKVNTGVSQTKLNLK